MLYLALQTAALIAATYFIGTLLGCLLHKFFNMLFSSKERRLATAGTAAVIGAGATTGNDLHLFEKNRKSSPIKGATLDDGLHDNRRRVLGQKIDTFIPGTLPVKSKADLVVTKTTKTATLAKDAASTPTAEKSKSIATPTVKTATVETPAVKEAADNLKTQIEVPKTNVATSEKSLDIPSKVIDDSIIDKARTQTIAKAGAAIGGVAAVATATVSKTEEATTKTKTLVTEPSDSLLTDAALTKGKNKAKPSFFSRFFRKSKPATKTAKGIENTANAAKKQTKIEASKPAVKLPVSEKGVEPLETIKEASSGASKIIVPAVVAGTAAAITKGDDVIKTVSKMSSEIITITDPKPSAEKETPEAITPPATEKVEVSAPPAPEPETVIEKVAETQNVAEKALPTEKIEAASDQDAGSPLDLDLSKLNEKDLLETTKTLKAMALKDD